MTDTTSAFRLNDTLAVRVRYPAGAERPLRLALLLDISESMAGERLLAVKRTLAAARPLWQPEDRTTLVTFGERGTPVLVDHLMDADGIQSFYTAVEDLHVDGCTNLSAGLEEVATAVAGRNYDALVVLTDGVVNRGLTSNMGLQTMALGLNLPATMLGYGADHNRQLLRDLALRSHGSYVYCDSDETLPVVIGQLLTELRTRVVARASLAVDGDVWTCSELGGAVIGSIVPDRDYWSVWKATAADAPAPLLTFNADGVGSSVAVVELVADAAEIALVKEQSLRARVAAALKTVADALETGCWADPAPVRSLNAEIAAESEEFRGRGLVLRLAGELAEICADLEARGPAPAPSTPPFGAARIHRQNARAWSPPGGPARLMARLSSQTAYLSTQRGVSSQAPDDDMFSSPAVRMASSGVHAYYSASAAPGGAHDPVPCSPPMAPLARASTRAVSPLPE